MIRGVAFDWGGIFTEETFDSDAVTNLSQLLSVSEERISGPYFPLMAEFETGAFGLDEFIARFRKESGLSFDSEQFRSTFLGSGRERAAMYRVLASIPDEYRVAVLSNNVPVLCDRVRNDERMQRVETFLFSNELGIRKPDSRAYAALVAAMQLPAEEIVFIDDSADNIRACREFGLNGIHLRDFEGFTRDLVALVPDIPVHEGG